MIEVQSYLIIISKWCTYNWLIPNYKEPLEGTEIASLQSEGKLKITLCNSVLELPVALDQIKLEALYDEYINRIKTKKLEKDQRTTDVFSVCGDVLLYWEHVVIPLKMHKRTLKDFHGGHPGSNKRKNLMHSFVYWLNMDKDIENAVKLYKGCALAGKSPPVKFKPLAIDWPSMV